MAQVTLMSFFEYQGFLNKWQALGRMGYAPLNKTKVKGLTFWKPLGSGSGNGFSIWPDFSTYGLLTVFENESSAKQFLHSSILMTYQSKAANFSHVLMYTIKTHGKWDKMSPFETHNALNQKSESLLAVITRATIKPTLVLKFWQNVPKVSKSMDNFDGLIYSKGIGEWPIFMQATFSLWAQQDAMVAYAYANKNHSEMIKKTRQLQWYSEELFARFLPFEILGNLIKI